MVKNRNSKTLKSITIGVICSLGLFLSACTKTEYIDVIRTVEVKVPITEMIEIEKIEKPEFPITKITLKSSHKDVVQYYFETVILYEKYTTVLENTILKINSASETYKNDKQGNAD